jgi:hypothetical protein
MTYKEAKALHGRARNIEKPLKHMTTLRQTVDGFCIKYWDTDVVTIHEDGSTYTLRSGGFHTQTTKERINEYSSAIIVQDKGLWYLTYQDFVPLGRILFEEGMKVDQYGLLVGKPTKGFQTATEYAKKHVDKLVRKYIKGFVGHVMEHGLEDPSGGDCWGCHFQDQNGSPDPMGISHYFNHFEEKYYVPSLLWNAIREAGYPRPEIIWHIAKMDIENGRRPRILVGALRTFFGKRKVALTEHLRTAGRMVEVFAQREHCGR